MRIGAERQPPDVVTHRFQRRLEAVTRRLRRSLREDAAGRLLLAAWVYLSATLLVDRWLNLSVPLRASLLIIGVVWLAVRLARRSGSSDRGTWSAESVCAALDRRHPDAAVLAEGWATMRDLAPRRGVAGHESPELLHLAVEEAERDLDAYDWSPHQNLAMERRRRAILCLALLVPIVAAAALPETMGLWWRRYFLASSERWPRQVHLEVEGLRGGRLYVARGEPYVVRARAKSNSKRIPDRIEVRWRIRGGGEGRADLTRLAENEFRIELPAVDEGAELLLIGGDDRLGPIEVVARARPRVSRFDVDARLTAVGLDRRDSFGVDEREPTFLAGTAVEVTAHFDQDCGEASLREDEIESTDPVLMRDGGRRARLSWMHGSRRRFSLHLVATETGLESRPQRLDIGLDIDRAPVVDLDVDGLRDRITPRALIPTRVTARDDRALVEVALEVSVGTSADVEEAELRVRSSIVDGPADAAVITDTEKHADIETKDAKAEIGSFLHLRAVARDRCHLGAQSGRSRPRVYRIVEDEVLFREITGRLERGRGRFRVTRDEAAELTSLVETAPPAELLRRHRLIERQVWATDRLFAAAARELELNRLTEAKGRALMDDGILVPLRDLQERLMRSQRVRLEGLVGDDVGDRAPIGIGQAAIVSRMTEILEAMREWDSFVDLVNQLDEVIDLQRRARRSTVDGGDKEGDRNERK